jgi:hypothetical protein
MRAVLIAALFAPPALAEEPPPALMLTPLQGGGYGIERGGAPGEVAPKGLASAAEIAPLLAREPAAARIDYSNGVKLDGVYTVSVGREDGTLAKFENATDLVAFAAPETMFRAGGVTTYEGAIVFALKIDNARVVQRFERGVVTLTRMRKSL